MPSLASVVLLSLALVSPVAAKDCPTEALLSLASNTNLATCQTETGVSVATISALTNAQIAKICKSSACLGLMADVASMHLGDCTIPGSSVTVQTDVLDRVTAACGGSSSAASTGSTGSEGSSRSSGATTVGDESSAGSSKSDKVVGGSTTGSSSAATVTVGFVSALALTAVALLV